MPEPTDPTLDDLFGNIASAADRLSECLEKAIAIAKEKAAPLDILVIAAQGSAACGGNNAMGIAAMAR